MTSNELFVPTSPGELIDKITILEIKSERIADASKLENVRRELKLLVGTRDEKVSPSARLDDLSAELKKVNEELWIIEDDIRDCERAKDFGPKFIDLARAVYFTNDKRAALKKEINLLTGSSIVEEKSYQEY